MSAARLPWLNDASQLRSLDALEYIALSDIDMALIVAEADWFVDGVDYEDPYDSEESTLRNLGQANSDLYDPLREEAWLSDDMTDNEAGALHYLAGVSENDLDLAKRLASSPWVMDGVARHEASALSNLIDLTVWNPELARRIVGYGLEAPVRNRDVYLITSLGRIRDINEDGFNRVITSSWFTDELDDEERAFLTALGFIDPPEFDDLLETRFTLSSTISLPLSGEVGVSIFQSFPFRPEDDLLSVVEDGARITEGFMGTPFPTNDIIILVVKDRASIGGWAGHFDEIMIRLSEDGTDLETVIHEISHFYFSAGPSWFTEGGADFLLAYSLDSLGVESWDDQMLRYEDNRQYCADNGIGDIHELNVGEHDGGLHLGCSYALGRYFFIGLFQTLGETAFSSALREMHLMKARNEIEYTDGLIYRTFLKHVPPDRVDEFRAVYSRLHGGPIEDYEGE